MNSDQARRECFKGQTIYCIALGLAEEKAGHLERALELYRSACKKHPTSGHLRACSPLLALARKMDRLEHEAAPLEARCREGNSTLCFYLGKEYLNISELERAADHLEPLCRNRFQSPDADDYGPCYHLAKGFERNGQWSRARALYQNDCDPNTEEQSPSCLALAELAELEKSHSHLRQQGIRSLRSLEAVMLFLVLMSGVHVVIWFRGGRPGMNYLSRWAPGVIWGGSLAWIFWPEKLAYPPSQWAVIFFVLLLSTGMAGGACLNLRASKINRDSH